MSLRAARPARDRRRRLAATAATVQPFLLDLANYSSAQPPDSILYAREFSLTAPATCLGLRCAIAVGGGTHGLRLYRASDSAQLAAEDVLVAAGTNLLYLTTPVSLAAATYRIGLWVTGAAGVMLYWDGAADHPDGPIVTLTANTFCYSFTDAYPADLLGASFAGEPIVSA